MRRLRQQPRSKIHVRVLSNDSSGPPIAILGDSRCVPIRQDDSLWFHMPHILPMPVRQDQISPEAVVIVTSVFVRTTASYQPLPPDHSHTRNNLLPWTGSIVRTIHKALAPANLRLSSEWLPPEAVELGTTTTGISTNSTLCAASTDPSASTAYTRPSFRVHATELRNFPRAGDSVRVANTSTIYLSVPHAFTSARYDWEERTLLAANFEQLHGD